MKAVLLEPLRLDLPPLAGLSRSGRAPCLPAMSRVMGFDFSVKKASHLLDEFLCVCAWQRRAYPA